MRANVPDYRVIAPSSLQEALKLLAAEPNRWTPLAGGTDIMVLYEAGYLQARELMSIWGIEALKGIESQPDHVDIGALTTYAALQNHAVIQAEFPNLSQAGSETGSIAIQNRGTIGGNIVNASPAADSPPALLTYNAQIELVSTQGSRWIPYSDFHLDYKRTVRQPNELLRTVRLPRSTKSRRHFYRKVGTRKAQAISKVVFAAVAELQGSSIGDIRLALGSVAPTTLLCKKTATFLQGKRLDDKTMAQACQLFEQETSPIDDIRSTAEYRRTVTQNLLRQFLLSLK